MISTVIVAVPSPDTCPPVTFIDSKRLLSLECRISILPDCANTVSLKLRIRSVLISTPVNPSDGEDEERVGRSSSAAIKVALELASALLA